jgi:hypothetical protein
LRDLLRNELPKLVRWPRDPVRLPIEGIKFNVRTT